MTEDYERLGLGVRAILEKIINIYRSEPCLWQIKNKDYHDRGKKNAAYKKLIVEYRKLEPNANREVIVRKLNSLRTNYRKERRKVEESTQSGAGTSDVYKPTLWYYELFKFLDNDNNDQGAPILSCTSFDEIENSQACTSTKQNTETDEYQKEEPTIKQKYTWMPRSTSTKQHTDADEYQKEERAVKRKYTKSKPQKRKSNLTTDLEDVQETMTGVITTITRIIKELHKDVDQEEDEFDLYGKLLAKKLRLFSQRESQEVMYDIDGLVLNRLQNQNDSLSYNIVEPVLSRPASTLPVILTKRSVSPCSPYTTPVGSPSSPSCDE